MTNPTPEVIEIAVQGRRASARSQRREAIVSTVESSLLGIGALALALAGEPIVALGVGAIAGVVGRAAVEDFRTAQAFSLEAASISKLYTGQQG